MKDSNQEWVMNLTDLSHAATRHKTYKSKGAMLLPLPKLIYPYLNELHAAANISESSLAVFPASSIQRRLVKSYLCFRLIIISVNSIYGLHCL